MTRSSEPSSRRLFRGSAVTRSFKAVKLHSCSAKAGSSNWIRSLTLTASPSLGFTGVVIKGKDDKNDTYFLHSVEVKKLWMRII